MTAHHDITGQRFGMLVALRRIGYEPGGSRWLCLCDCGWKHSTKLGRLRSGAVKSCGCSTSELIASAVTTHGKKSSGAYASWASMKQRCLNTKAALYPYYGGRGITICDSWLSFESFYADMGDRPAGHSIERIDCNGPYAPHNCKWIPKCEQSKNRRSTRFVNFNGQRMPLVEAANLAGVPYRVVHTRIQRGWPEDRLLVPLVTPHDRIDAAWRKAKL